MKKPLPPAACLLAAALLAAPGAALAGAWAQPEGRYYAKLSGILYSADEVYNEMGRRTQMGMDEDAFDGRQSFLYLEYGLRERLTVVSQVSAGVLRDESRLVRRETTGIGDLELGLKYQLVDGPVVAAPMLSVKVPTGYDADFEPPLGTGRLDGELRLLLSRSLYPRPLYAGLDLAYRLRGGPFSNQRTWAAEVGATPHRSLFVKAQMQGTSTLRSSAGDDLGLVGGSTQVSEGDFVKTGVNVAVRVFDPVWLDLLYERVVDGENIGAGSSWGVGLSVSR